MDNFDIVTELRHRHANCTGNDPRITPIVGGTIFLQAADEIERLRVERDEARREVCGLDADIMEDQIEYAKHRGWDCFKENK